MLGAIIGDIVGSVYEFNNTKRKDFPLFCEESNYTDDTVMSMAVLEALMDYFNDEWHRFPVKSYLVDFANKYPCPKGGYGGRFRKWLFDPRQLSPDGERHPYKSWGNGSAMRVSAVGWLSESFEQAEDLAKFSAEVTHNHPEGIKGAQATAVAIYMARHGKSKEEIRSLIEQRYGYNLHRTCDEIRPTYKFDESCQGTVPEAIIAFLESSDFEDAIRLAVSLGGDSDTLACITGGIAEAFYKHIPDWIRCEAYHRLPEDFCKKIEIVYSWAERVLQCEKENAMPREKRYALWQLDQFYKHMAEEENTTAKTRCSEIEVLEYTVAGSSYCKDLQREGEEFIKEGMTLRMKRENNPHDKNAIALYIDDVKVGYIPKSQNAVIVRLMDAGKIFVSRVTYANFQNGWKNIEAKLWMVEL